MTADHAARDAARSADAGTSLREIEESEREIWLRNCDQAMSLMGEACQAGLTLEVWLSPDQARHALSAVLAGHHPDPAGAVADLLREMFEMLGHPDLRREACARMVRSQMEETEKGPTLDLDALMADLEKRMRDQPEIPQWKRMAGVL